MSHKLTTFIGAFAIVLFTTACSTGGHVKPQVSAVEVPQRILFVGNSFTYYNDSLHKHVGALLRAAGRHEAGKTSLRAMTISGARLAEHLPGLAGIVTPGRWDMVIMHGYSNGPIQADTAPAFQDAASQASALVAKSGATPAFLMTWAYKDQPEMTAALNQAYTRAGNDNDALVIPVGQAFARAMSKAPEIELYSPDILGFDARDDAVNIRYKKVLKHPSLAGTYLAACVVYASIYGESPVGLVYGAGLPAADARKLQEIASKVVNNYYDR